MSVPSAPDRTYDRVRYHRGSRGFAAFVTGLNAAVLLLALFVTPTLGLSQPAAAWFVILVGGAGIAHVAAIGPIRGRAWSGSLVGYLAAAGIASPGSARSPPRPVWRFSGPSVEQRSASPSG